MPVQGSSTRVPDPSPSPDIVILDLSITLRLVPTYVDIPSDPGLTPQHNSLAHNIKLYAERLPMFRAPETAVGFSANDLNCR